MQIYVACASFSGGACSCCMACCPCCGLQALVLSALAAALLIGLIVGLIVADQIFGKLQLFENDLTLSKDRQRKVSCW